jgi:hypothetical protein
MMKIKFSCEMLDMDGKSLRDKVPSGEKNMMGQDILVDGPISTLGSVAINALLAVFQDEQGLTGEEKLRRWELAVKIKRTQGELDLELEEVLLVKKLIGKAYGPAICGQAWNCLDGKCYEA